MHKASTGGVEDARAHWTRVFRYGDNDADGTVDNGANGSAASPTPSPVHSRFKAAFFGAARFGATCVKLLSH